ncbi:roadblock/LC7 domain-containing protein [Desulfotalea psychrophila]
MKGVNTAYLVGRDGFPQNSITRQSINTEMIGAIVSSGFSSAKSMANQLG